MAYGKTEATAAQMGAIPTEVRVVIHPALIKGIWDLALNQPLEWTMMGHMTTLPNGAIRVDDLIVPYQESLKLTTDIPTEAFIEGEKFDPTYEWRARGIEGIELDPTKLRGGDWNVTIHSHNTMGAFWSGTDITELLNSVKERTENFVHIVVNAKREYKCIVGISSLKIFSEGKIFVEDLSLADYFTLEQSEKKKVDEEYTKFSDIAKKLPASLAKYTIIRPPVVTTTTNRGWENKNTYGKRQSPFPQLNAPSNDSKYDMSNPFTDEEWEEYLECSTASDKQEFNRKRAKTKKQTRKQKKAHNNKQKQPALDIPPTMDTKAPEANDMGLLISPVFIDSIPDAEISLYFVELAGYYICDPATLKPRNRILDPSIMLQKIIEENCIVAHFSLDEGPESIYWPEELSNSIPLFLKPYLDEDQGLTTA